MNGSLNRSALSKKSTPKTNDASGGAAHNDKDVSTESEADEMDGVQNVCEKDEGLSQLHLAAERGDTETVRRMLIPSANVDVLDRKHNTPLHIATLNGHVDVVRLLLKKNECVNFRNALGQTSLHLASEIGHLTITQLLLDSHADVHVTDQFMNTSIHIASMHGHYELVQLLMNHSVLLICYGNRPLHLAAKYGRTEVVQFLLKYDENPDARNLDGETPLHIASENGHFQVVEVLLRNNADANIRNASYKTPLHIAAELGYAEIVKAMIDHKDEVNAVDGNGNTALHYAAINGHLEVVEFLLRNNADVNFGSAFCETPLHIAAEMGYAKIVTAMIGHKVDVNAIDRNGDTALHYAARNGVFGVVEVLLRNNADANMHNASGKTPLHNAAKMGYVEIVGAMIDHKGEVNAVDRNGDTVLHYAACNGHTAVANVLLNQTTDRNAQIRSQLAVNQVCADEIEPSQHSIKNKVDVGHTSHLIAKEGDNIELADTLLGHSSTTHAVFIDGKATPLYLAVEHGHTNIFKNLISNGANVNACNNDKMTPLHLACQSGHTSVVEILLNNHAIVDVTKQTQNTPFYLSVKNGHASVSDLLIRRGVCYFAEFPFKYKSPLQVAIEERHTEVVEVILKHIRSLSEKLTKEGENLQKNPKRGVIPVELLKSDGRRVSAEIVWTERNIPLEIQRNSDIDAPLVLTAYEINLKMVQLMLIADQRMYSEMDIADIFGSIITRMHPVYSAHEALSDSIKYKEILRRLAKFLINSSKFNVNYQDNELNSNLHNTIRQLREQSSSGYLNNESKRLCLHNQIINEVIQLLLEKGADFNIKNSYGETPLIIASEKGRCDAIQTLFDWEEKSGMKLDLDARDQFGATALIKAVERHHVSVVRQLLGHKASANLCNYCGFTALHAAVYDLNRNWADLHVFRKGLRKRKFNSEEYPQVDHRDDLTWIETLMNRIKAIYRLQKILEHYEKTTQIKEEIIKWLTMSNNN